MKEKLQKTFKKITSDKKKTLYSIIAIVLVLATSFIVFSANGSQKDMPMNAVSSYDAMVTTVGSSTDGISSPENSWPGEVVSLSNIQVQPAREGSVVEWYVHVGERVYQGQIIGKLSKPSATPELISMLADKGEALSATRAQVEAERAYTAKRIDQLKQLRDKIESNQSDRAVLLGGGASSTTPFSVVDIKKRAVRATLLSSVTKTNAAFTGQKSVPLNYYAVQLRSSIGAVNSGLRGSYIPALSAVMADLNDPSKIPSQTGIAYFDTAIKLANTSVSGNEDFTDSDLDSLKTMLVDSQTAFIAALNDEKMAELDINDKQKDSFSQLRDIDAQIAELEKNLSTAEGEIQAKEVAYDTVNGAVNGGYSILASKSGTVSSILKKVGEFVSPGTAVAIIAGDNNNERIIRFKIPNNVRKPLVGNVLSVVRPGFTTQLYKAKIIGVGASLDDIGAYMSDAVLLDKTDWVSGTSVRLTVAQASSTITVPMTSIFFASNGAPKVWKVSSAGRVYSQALTLGRTLGASVEVYAGLVYGESYIANPTSEIQEDVLLDDLRQKTEEKNPSSSGKGGMKMEDMPGM